MAGVSAHVSRSRNARAKAEAFMETKTIAIALGLLAAATLLVADGARAGRSGGGHDDGAAHAGGLYGSARAAWHGGGTRWVGGRSSYPGTYNRAGGYYGRWGWGAAAEASTNAKAAARAAYDTRDYDFLHRCYQPQRVWNGAYYTWRLVSVC
jgi:hypothetical protein